MARDIEGKALGKYRVRHLTSIMIATVYQDVSSLFIVIQGVKYKVKDSGKVAPAGLSYAYITVEEEI